ncbi:MAG TPA: EAL domain-containing protein [Candidatus Aquilonibacter sp.]
MTRDLYGSTLNKHIYGFGAFYKRGGFGAPDVLWSVYVRRYDPRTPVAPQDHRFPGGVEVDYTSRARDRVSDYTGSVWFRAGLEGNGATVYEGPYFDEGRWFISILRAFFRNGRIAGIVSVDVLETDFQAIMARDVSPGDVAWVRLAHGGKFVVGTAPVPHGPHLRAASLSLRYTPHTNVEMWSDARALDRRNAGIWITTAALLAIIWTVAVLMSVGIVQRWRAQEVRHRLEREHFGLEREIEISRAIEAKLRIAAFTDALTGLPNRSAFMERAGQVLGEEVRDAFAVFFIDLDRFNIVNETLGHLAGDDLLRTIGERLHAVISSGDMIARLGGDEFVILALLPERRPLLDVALQLLAHLGEPIVIHGRSIYPEASIGVVALDESYGTADEVLRDADIAMYEAKRRGRAQCVLFDAEMRRKVASDSDMEDALRRALERGELVPHYQPIVNVRTGRISGFEALVRWHRPDGSTAAARDFMPFAEQHGLVAAIDVRVLHEVCRHTRAILDMFPRTKIAVNISASELATPGLAQTVEEMIASRDCSAASLKLEITETTMMTSSDAARRTIERLREIGIEFVLDDFGTGYSSLAYLQGLPINELKIDRSFVEPLLNDRKAVEIVQSIVLLARSFGLLTTAEGVESVEQFELLEKLGVDFAQGFFFSPAVDIASLISLQARSISPRRAVE